MTVPKPSKPAPVTIRNDVDGDRPFILHPEDSDLFVRTGRQVIDACGLHVSVELWLREMNAMLHAVRAWAEAHADAVRSCFAAPLGSRMAVFVVPQGKQFNFDLADELASLNIHLVKEFNVGMVELHQIPFEEIDRFIDPANARWVYGEQPAPHPTVEA